MLAHDTEVFTYCLAADQVMDRLGGIRVWGRGLRLEMAGGFRVWSFGWESTEVACRHRFLSYIGTSMFGYQSLSRQ